MLVHESMENLPPIPFPVVTMGSFDGVHVGHRVIIKRLNQLAKRVGGSSVLITFHPHPRKVLYPETAGKGLRLINSPGEKIRLLEETGLDHLIILEFTLAFSRTTSGDFVEQYLVGRLRAHTIVVGFNHFFGHNKEGNYDSLYRLRGRFGFEVEEIPEQEIQHETVSSTKIRKALAEGNIQRANAYLDHHYFMFAQLEYHGGYSLRYQHSCYLIRHHDPLKLLPPPGRYAVSLQTEQGPQKGILYIGTEGMLLLPLDPQVSATSTDAGIQFHKRIAGLEIFDPSRDLDAVRELIY
jgi:riboflavin kinase/FMN adenylyltransferase